MCVSATVNSEVGFELRSETSCRAKMQNKTGGEEEEVSMEFISQLTPLTAWI